MTVCRELRYWFSLSEQLFPPMPRRCLFGYSYKAFSFADAGFLLFLHCHFNGVEGLGLKVLDDLKDARYGSDSLLVGPSHRFFCEVLQLYRDADFLFWLFDDIPDHLLDINLLLYRSELNRLPGLMLFLADVLVSSYEKLVNRFLKVVVLAIGDGISIELALIEISFVKVFIEFGTHL